MTKDVKSLETENYGIDNYGFPKQSVDPIIKAQLKDQETHFIKYRPEWNKYTGGPIETIVFLELLYWFQVSGFKPFYKFIKPAQHPQYKKNDSLVEATGCSYFQINKTIKQIGFKIGGKKPKDQIPNSSSEALIWYKQTQNRKTYWAINMDYYRIIYAKIMGGVEFPNSRNLNFQIQETEISTIYTETTHSITTNTKGNLSGGEKSPHPTKENSEGLQENKSSEIPQELLDLAYNGKVKELLNVLSRSTGALFSKIKYELLPIARKNKNNPFKRKRFVNTYTPTVKSKSYTSKSKSSKTIKPVDISNDDIKLISVDTFLHPGVIKKQLEIYKLWVEENEVKVKNHLNRFKLSFLSRIEPNWDNCNSRYKNILIAREYRFAGGEKQYLKDYLRDMLNIGWLNKEQYWERISKLNLASATEIEKAKQYGFNTDGLTPFNDITEERYRKMKNETK